MSRYFSIFSPQDRNSSCFCSHVFFQSTRQWTKSRNPVIWSITQCSLQWLSEKFQMQSRNVYVYYRWIINRVLYGLWRSKIENQLSSYNNRYFLFSCSIMVHTSASQGDRYCEFIHVWKNSLWPHVFLLSKYRMFHGYMNQVTLNKKKTAVNKFKESWQFESGL
jgi:hypothetical protein